MSILLCISILVTASGCNSQEPNVSNVNSSSINIADESSTESLTSGNESTSMESTNITSSDSNTSVISDNVLKPNSTSKSGTTSSNATVSGTAQVLKADLIINTPQEKKFASLKGSTVRVIIEAIPPTGSDADIRYKYMEKKYGVKIVFVVMTRTEVHTKLAQMVAANDVPDSVTTDEDTFLRYVYANLIQPLSINIVADSTWNAEALKMYTTNSKVYAIAESSPKETLSTYMVWFNKTLFKERNVKNPYDHYKAGTWNMSQFVQTCKDIKIFRADGTTIQTYSVGGWYLLAFLLANGGKLINETKPGVFVSTLSSPAEMSGLQTLYELFNASNPLYSSEDAYTGFRQRKIAMHIERPDNAIGAFDYYNKMDDEIGMAPMPMGMDGKYYAPVGFYGRCVPRNAKNPLGGLMVAYETYQLSHDARINPKTAYDLEQRRKSMSDEHFAIYSDYMKKATQIYTMQESLSGWWESNRGKFWNYIQAGKTPPAQLVDTLNGLLKDSIRRTTG